MVAALATTLTACSSQAMIPTSSAGTDSSQQAPLIRPDFSDPAPPDPPAPPDGPPQDGGGGGGGSNPCGDAVHAAPVTAKMQTDILVYQPPCGGGPAPTQVACSGTPSQCQNIPCNGSQLSIGSQFQWNGQDVTVTDINSLWQSSAGQTQQVGWIYQASNGARYIQGDLSSQPGVNWSISAGIISAGVSSPGTYTPITHYSGYLPANTGSSKCESQGSQLA